MTTELSMENQIVAAIRRIMRAVDLHSRQLVEGHGLTGPQLATLQAVARIENVSAGALARAVHLSGPTVTGILDRLAKRGLIQRIRNGQDRRSVTIQLTPDGEACVARAPSLLQDRFRNELVRLEEWERSMILATLQRIAAMMDAESLDASPVLVPGPLDSPGQKTPTTTLATGVAAGCGQSGEPFQPRPPTTPDPSGAVLRPTPTTLG